MSTLFWGTHHTRQTLLEKGLLELIEPDMDFDICAIILGRVNDLEVKRTYTLYRLAIRDALSMQELYASVKHESPAAARKAYQEFLELTWQTNVVFHYLQFELNRSFDLLDKFDRTHCISLHGGWIASQDEVVPIDVSSDGGEDESSVSERWIWPQ